MKIENYYKGWIADFLCKYCTYRSSGDMCSTCKVADAIEETNQ